MIDLGVTSVIRLEQGTRGPGGSASETNRFVVFDQAARSSSCHKDFSSFSKKIMKTVTLFSVAGALVGAPVGVHGECCFRIGYGVQMKPCCLKILPNCDGVTESQLILGGNVGRTETCPATADVAATAIKEAKQPHDGDHTPLVLAEPNPMGKHTSENSEDPPKHWYSNWVFPMITLVLVAAAMGLGLARIKRGGGLTQRLLGAGGATAAAGGGEGTGAME